MALGALLLAAQVRPDSTFVDTSAADADSSFLVDTILYQQSQSLAAFRPVTNPENFEKQLYQRPTVALFKSMAVPGLGQFGNRRYVKAVLFFGLDAWLVGSAIHYGRQAADFRNQFESITDTTEAARRDRNDYYFLYEDRKDERNKFTWFAVIVTFISMFDAYVDAHLSGFPRKSEDNVVRLNLGPSFKGDLIATVSIAF